MSPDSSSPNRLARAVAIVLLCFCSLPLLAQQFSVSTFRLLPNDISAYINPVRDLNQEACALVKVVGDKDFVFSTPLGIVKRRNDVGEIWIYLPHGSIQLTIKHPQWGVLRDYRFPVPLESRMTYELVLATPIVNVSPSIPPIADKHSLPPIVRHIPASLPYPPASRPKRPRERLHFLALAQAGIHGSAPSFGIRAAAMRRHGAYLSLLTNLHAMPSTQGSCNREGIPAGESGSPYYTGQTQEGRRMIFAGALHRIAGEFCLYEGIGYGKRTVGWETASGEWLRNTAYSAQGLSAEIGGIWRFRRIALSAGVATIAASHWEATAGIGFHF